MEFRGVCPSPTSLSLRGLSKVIKQYHIISILKSVLKQLDISSYKSPICRIIVKTAVRYVKMDPCGYTRSCALWRQRFLRAPVYNFGCNLRRVP